MPCVIDPSRLASGTQGTKVERINVPESLYGPTLETMGQELAQAVLNRLTVISYMYILLALFLTRTLQRISRDLQLLGPLHRSCSIGTSGETSTGSGWRLI